MSLRFNKLEEKVLERNLHLLKAQATRALRFSESLTILHEYEERREPLYGVDPLILVQFSKLLESAKKS